MLCCHICLKLHPLPLVDPGSAARIYPQVPLAKVRKKPKQKKKKKKKKTPTPRRFVTCFACFPPCVTVGNPMRNLESPTDYSTFSVSVSSKIYKTFCRPTPNFCGISEQCTHIWFLRETSWFQRMFNTWTHYSRNSGSYSWVTEVNPWSYTWNQLDAQLSGEIITTHLFICKQDFMITYRKPPSLKDMLGKDCLSPRTPFLKDRRIFPIRIH